VLPIITKGRNRYSDHQPFVVDLLYFSTALFPVTFARQSLLDTLFLARLQIKGVTLDLLNNVLCLDLTFEAAQGVLYGFALLNLYFCQLKQHPQTDRKLSLRTERRVLI
jgi:hypothetical protein